MRRAMVRPALVFVSPATSMPGELWARVYPDGETTTYLFDSTLEAAVFARHWEADLRFDMPDVLDPRRAVDYSDFADALPGRAVWRSAEKRISEEHPEDAVGLETP